MQGERGTEEDGLGREEENKTTQKRKRKSEGKMTFARVTHHRRY